MDSSNNKKDIKVALIDKSSKISLDYIQKQLEQRVKEVAARKERGEKEIELVDYISLISFGQPKLIPTGLSDIYTRISQLSKSIKINLETGHHERVLNDVIKTDSFISPIRNNIDVHGNDFSKGFTNVIPGKDLGYDYNNDAIKAYRDFIINYNVLGGKLSKEDMLIDGVYFNSKADWIKKANTVKTTQLKSRAKPSKLMLSLTKNKFKNV